MVEYVECPDIWLYSLPNYLYEYVGALAGEDEYNLIQMGKCKHVIENGKYKNNPRKQRMKMRAVQRQLSDAYLYNFLKKRNIIISLICHNLAEYWKERNSYENIMAELDKLIIKPTCDCRHKGLGLCFCRDNAGNFTDPPWI